MAAAFTTTRLPRGILIGADTSTDIGIVHYLFAIVVASFPLQYCGISAKVPSPLLIRIE